MTAPVVVVGAGLAGLACAATLTAAGREVLVLEASDGVGGRVRTDVVDGFRLDRGFQIYLTAYPEGEAMLDVDALELRTYDPGALVWADGALHRVGDPLRRPSDLVGTLRAPVGGYGDKLRIARLALSLRGKDTVALLGGPDRSTAAELEARGFSDRIVNRLLRPLFAGIQLDGALATSSRNFRFIFGMLARGSGSVPATGMQAIPDQLAARLPGDAVRLGARVVRAGADSVELESGQVVAGSAVVVATEGPEASRLLGLPPVASKPVGCVYFAADASPFPEPLVALDGEGTGPAVNVAVVSNVAPGYAPPGAALIAAACLDTGPDLADRVRAQLAGWFGGAVAGWRHLRTYRIEHGQPAQLPPFTVPQSVLLPDGRFVAGDHRDTASINGALASGRRAAEAILVAG